jgi:hypothetical protein
LEPGTEEADEVTGDRTISTILMGAKGLFLSDALSPSLQQLRGVPLTICQSGPAAPDGIIS